MFFCECEDSLVFIESSRTSRAVWWGCLKRQSSGRVVVVSFLSLLRARICESSVQIWSSCVPKSSPACGRYNKNLLIQQKVMLSFYLNSRGLVHARLRERRGGGEHMRVHLFGKMLALCIRTSIWSPVSTWKSLMGTMPTWDTYHIKVNSCSTCKKPSGGAHLPSPTLHWKLALAHILRPSLKRNPFFRGYSKRWKGWVQLSMGGSEFIHWPFLETASVCTNPINCSNLRLGTLCLVLVPWEKEGNTWTQYDSLMLLRRLRMPVSQMVHS